MSGRLRVPVFRGGQGRPVEVPLTETHEPMTWDACEQRVKDLLAYTPILSHVSCVAMRGRGPIASRNDFAKS